MFFRIFWSLDGVKITRKCRFWTRSVPKHRNRHLTRLSTPKDGRTLQKVCGPLLPKSEVRLGYVRLGYVPERVEFRLRCLNRGNLTLRIRIRRFRVISTPSGGQKWRKTWFFRVLLNRKSPRHLGDRSWKQKMFVYNI